MTNTSLPDGYVPDGKCLGAEYCQISGFLIVGCKVCGWQESMPSEGPEYKETNPLIIKRYPDE